MDSIFLSRLLELGFVVLPDGNGSAKADPRSVGAVLHTFASLGFALDKESLEKLSHADEHAVKYFYRSCYAVMAKAKGENVKHIVFYRNFPHLEDLTGLDYFVNSFLHYVSADEYDYGYMPQGEERDRLPFIPDEVETVHIISEQEGIDRLAKYCTACFESHRAIPSAETVFLHEFEHAYPNHIRPKAMPFKENLATFVAVKCQGTEKWGQRLSRECLDFVKTATDLLRLYAAMSHSDVSLRSRWISLTFLDRPCRRLFVEILNDLTKVPELFAEDLRRHEFLWKLTFKYLHIGEYAKKFPKLYEIVTAFRQNKLDTYYAKLERAKADQDEYLRLLSTRPSEFARRLDATLRNSSYDTEKTLEAFASIIQSVAPTVLISLWEFYHNRAENGPRVFKFHGSRAIMLYVTKKSLPPMDNALKETVIEHIERALREIYAKRPRVENVYLDESAKLYALPSNNRNASRGHKTLTYGTRIPIDTEKYPYLRAFVHWKNMETGRVDVDLSAEFYRDDFRYGRCVAWHDYSAVALLDCYHSGDLVTAPEGASEFLDVNLEKAREEYRFLTINATVYTGQDFADIPECFAGIAFVPKEAREEGKIFQANLVRHRYDLTTRGCNQVTAFAVDLKTMEIIWMDAPTQTGVCGVAAENHSIGYFLRDAMKKRMDLYTFFKLHEGHVSFVDDIAKADYVISDKEGATLYPYDAQTIGAEWL